VGLDVYGTLDDQLGMAEHLRPLLGGLLYAIF